jgi:hypothetical protein
LIESLAQEVHKATDTIKAYKAKDGVRQLPKQSRKVQNKPTGQAKELPQLNTEK